MGYLSVGIANKIFVNRKDIPEGDLENQFDKNFKLELYDIEEGEDKIILTLKREMLEKNVVDLLEEIKKKARGYTEGEYEQSKKALRNKTYDEMIDSLQNELKYALAVTLIG